MFDMLKNILVTKLKVAPEQITPEATKDDLDLDSLAVVELAMLLEKDLGLMIGDDELHDAGTVAEIVTLMEQRSVAR